jgi:hypothetical protein
MGSTWVEIEFFCVVARRMRGLGMPRPDSENIDEFRKDADDGDKRCALHADQPRKFSIDFSESTIHV